MPQEWYSSWFDTDYYHTLYQNRDEKEAEFFIKNLINFLPLNENSKVLDAGCGKGRHAQFFNSLGFDVEGFDLSENSILNAKKFENEKLHFFVHDLRKTFKYNYFDLVCNLFTSFGYFENHRENNKVVETLYNATKKNGFIVIDYLNPTFVINNLSTEEKIIEIDHLIFRTQKKLDNNFVVKNIHIIDKNIKAEYNYEERVYLYSAKDFEDMFAQKNVNLYALKGNYKLDEFDEQKSDRQILILKKDA